MMRGIAVIALLVLAACYPDPFGRSSVELRDEKRQCEADADTFMRGGISQALMCFRETEDAGKACSRSTDCEGLCVLSDKTDTGECAAETPQFGCIPMFDDNGDQVTICID